MTIHNNETTRGLCELLARVTPKPATVREFSAIGPCLTLGELMHRTASTVVFRLADGGINRRGGYRVKSGLVHTAPCRYCRDHPQTQYPNGYEN